LGSWMSRRPWSEGSTPSRRAEARASSCDPERCATGVRGR
jgi:hypothetical protein